MKPHSVNSTHQRTFLDIINAVHLVSKFINNGENIPMDEARAEEKNNSHSVLEIRIFSYRFDEVSLQPGGHMFVYQMYVTSYKETCLCAHKSHCRPEICLAWFPTSVNGH